MIFTHLPDDVFNLLSGSAKYLYAEVLLDLFDHFYGDDASIHPPERSELIDRIAIVAKKPVHKDVHDPDGNEQVGMSGHPTQIYYRLRDCGWLDEIRDGYRIIVDMPPEIILLLSALEKIKAGAARNYTGTVASILASVERAYNYPNDHGAALAEAARQTKELIHHLRAMTASLRRLEERVVRQPDPASVFKKFFEEFVGDFIVDQYKSLLTRNNPWRYRTDIVSLSETILEDSHKVSVLSDVYLQTEALTSVDDARQRVLNDLQAIRSAFDGIDSLRSTIDQFKGRVERRAVNTIRYMDRIDREDINRLTTAIRKLASLKLNSEDFAPLKMDLMEGHKPLGGAFLYTPRRKIVRRKPEPRTVSLPDPALRLRKEAKLAFQRRMRPGSEQIAAYLAELEFDSDGKVESDDLRINSLDDFVVFDALRRMAGRNNNGGTQGAAVTHTPDQRVDNPWISCPAFQIHTIKPETEEEKNDAEGS